MTITDNNKELLFGAVDFQGQETIVARYELFRRQKDLIFVSWSMLAPNSTYLYTSRGLWSKRGGNLLEILVIDTDSFRIVHSFELQRVSIESLGFKKSVSL